MKAHDGMYIDGEWRPAAGPDVIEVVNPVDEQVIGTGPGGHRRGRRRRRTGRPRRPPGWAATPPAERAARLAALRDVLAARKDEIAETVTAELGSPLTFSQAVHAGVPIAVAGSYAELAATHAFEEKVGNSTVYQEPIGVVGAITPWNYPLHQIVAKVAPALAAGCTVVLKPAEDTPLVAQLFAEAVHEAGVPAGVFNLVTGLGPVAGQALAEHPGVDLVSFTGSTAVGTADRRDRRRGRQEGRPGTRRQVRQRHPAERRPGQGGQRRRRQRHVQLRPDVQRLDPDAGPPRPVRRGRRTRRRGRRQVRRPHRPRRQRQAAGHGCAVTSRRASPRAPGWSPAAPNPRARQGYFVSPTVFADVTPDMTIAQEEIFGPVLSVLRYEDEEDALRIANGTVYGLAGAVWAGDEAEAVAFARRMDTGQVDINGGRFNPLAPFGGYKQSGVGRELGSHGLAEYLQTKSLQF